MRSDPHGRPRRGNHAEWASLELGELERRLGASVAGPEEESDVWPPDGISSGDLIADAAFFSFTAPEAVRDLDLPAHVVADLLRAAALPGEVGLSAWHRIARRIRLDACDGTLRRLLPPLYANLRGHTDAGRLAGAKAAAVESWCRGQRLEHVMRGVLHALSDAGVAFLPIGGTALVTTYYAGDWSRRWTSRIRLLVRSPLPADAESGLGGDGWNAIPDADGVHTGHRHFEKDGVNLALHVGLVGSPRTESADETTWQAAVPAKGLFARSLCPTDDLLYVCTRADLTGGSLSWAVDATTILRSAEGAIDWTRLRSMAVCAGAGDGLRQALLFLRTHLDATVPDSAMPAPVRQNARTDDRDRGNHRTTAPPLVSSACPDEEPAPLARGPMTNLGLVRRGPLAGASCLPWLARILAQHPNSTAQDITHGMPHIAELTRFAAAHDLGPLLSQRTDHPALRHSLPEVLRQSWKSAYVSRWLANQRLVYWLRGLRLAFSEAGIDCLLLKGPHLAERFYGDLAQRTFDDIDLLVRPDRVEPCLHLLAKLGFSNPTPRYPLPWGLSWLLRGLTHGTSQRRGELAVDVHWALRCHPSFAIDDARIWATREGFTLPGRGEEHMHVPADEYVLVLTVLGIFDDLSRLLLPVKGLIDAFLILRAVDSIVDWSDFLSRRRAERLHAIVVDVLTMIVELFAARELLPRLVAALETQGTTGSRSLKVTRGPANRLGVIWSYRLQLYDMPRAISFAHFLVTAPIRTVLF